MDENVVTIIKIRNLYEFYSCRFKLLNLAKINSFEFIYSI